MPRALTIGIIPARGGSKGIPRKNVRHLGNKPLIAHTIDAAKHSSLEVLVVSSDDDEILNVSRERGVRCIKRPAALAADGSPTVDALVHALAVLKEDPDLTGRIGSDTLVATLQPTSPLRNGRHIDQALDLLFDSRRANGPGGGADSLVSVITCPHNMTPPSLMALDGAFLRPILEAGHEVYRRQDKPRLFARNGAAIYLSSYELIVGERKILGQRLLPFFMDKISSLDIDDLEDWFIAEAILAARPIED